MRYELRISCALALALGACSDARSNLDWEAVVDTVGDTVTVRTISGSVWGDTAHLESRVSIGVVEGADEYVIGNPRSIAVGPDGTVYVLDRQVPSVRAYGADGQYLRDIGREGRGPGEYTRPGGIAMLPDGRLLVRDPGNARIVVFGPDGAYLEQWWLSGTISTPRRYYVDTAGCSYATILFNRFAPPSEWILGLSRYSPTGEVLDSLTQPVWDYEAAEISATADDAHITEPVPFTPSVSWTLSPLGYTIGGLSSSYRIDLFRSDQPVLRIERDWMPVRVLSGEREELRRLLTAQFAQDFPGWRWNGPAIPVTKPAFRDLFVSWEGNLWVLVSQEAYATMTVEEAREIERRGSLPPLRYREPAAFDVFQPDGQFLGHVRVPASFRATPEPIIRGDTVWAVTRDELDVATVVRFEVVRSTPESS